MNKSEFVALSKFSFSSGGGASASDDSAENVGIFVVNCGSVFGDAIIGCSPGVAPTADVAACVAAAVIDAGMPACVAAFVAAFVSSATAICFKRFILCVCGVSVGVGWLVCYLIPTI